MSAKDTKKDMTSLQEDLLKKGYDMGFKFAINYLIAWMPEKSAEGKKCKDEECLKVIEDIVEFNSETFKEFVGFFVGAEMIDDKYFEKTDFYIGSVYPVGQCPNREPPPEHIECPGSRVRPIPKPGSSPITLIEWLASQKAKK